MYNLNYLKFGLFTLVFISFMACNNKMKPQADINPELTITKDLVGVFVGNLPCENCEFHRMIIDLKDGSNFVMQSKVAGRDQSIDKFEGTYETMDDGRISLDMGIGSMWYQHRDGKLLRLSNSGEASNAFPEDEYYLETLKPGITNRYWVLTEVLGQAVNPEDFKEQGVPYMFIKEDGTSVFGYSGCNVFSGTVELTGSNGINFFPLAGTMRACLQNVKYEAMFHSSLDKAEQYIIKDNTMMLVKSKMAPFARFEEELIF